jgi:hypothetical protein
VDNTKRDPSFGGQENKPQKISDAMEISHEASDKEANKNADNSFSEES